MQSQSSILEQLAAFFLTSFGDVNWNDLFGFSLRCGVFSAGILALDCLSSWAGYGSIFRITHGIKTFLYLLVYFLGASIAGFLGLFLNIYQPSNVAAILVAVSWPTLIRAIKRMAQSKSESEDD